MCMNDPELVAEFVTESSESLADIENQLLAIEAAGADIDVDLVNTVFRGVHSIKGVAGFLGLNAINELAHNLEDVLNRIRNRELVPTSAIVDVMLKAADELSEMVSQPESSNDIDISRHLVALKSILSESPPADHENSKDAADTSRQESEIVNLAEATIEKVEEEVSDKQLPPAKEVSTLQQADQTSPNQTPLKPSNAVEKTATTPVETSIRVPVSTLDHLMNLAGELVLNRNRLVQYSCSQSDTNLVTLSSEIDHITCELQEAIMQTRMQPIATAFNRFPRIVRDLSSRLGKECDLVVEGKDVEVDKSIIEAIGDPLTHLIRNSVDHGIEMPDVRQTANKPATGTIRLSAYHRAGQVCIDIQDDGGGINTDRLKEKAIGKGILTERQAAEMGAREALRLIFHPGFSTAENLTDVSGRGVGMDVVRTNIERIGGTVDVESELGKGTTIHIVLPLTLAIIRSLIIGCQSKRFAIPQVNVAELVRISEKEKTTRIRQINDAVVLCLRDELIPLVELNEVLGFKSLEKTAIAEKESCVKKLDGQSDSDIPSVKAGAKNIVVLETGRSRYGIIVDQLFDSEEIVVKPLGMHLKHCPSFAGATILGDGRVALILDITGIADKAKIAGVDEDAVNAALDSTHKNEDLLRLLIFRNAPEEQFAIPMALVARIERVATADIEQLSNRLVTQYRGGTLPLLSIEKTISAAPRLDSDFVSVVILTSEDREYGVIAPSIEDIREVPVAIDVDALQEPGVMGSQVIDGVTTRILDVCQIYDTNYPEVAKEKSANHEAAADVSQTILIAEDSKFFRRQVANFLKSSAYEVLEAEDGVDAWNVLQKEQDKVDLLVTDIEMPNMTGFELCEKIRANEQFDNLPIVALTSLASEDDVRRGQQCGINEYQVKMDRDKLLGSIHSLLKC